MATRMTTLLYSGKPGADVAPGNRADAEDEPYARGMNLRLLPPIELRAYAVDWGPERRFVPPPRAPLLPPPTIALPTLLLALACMTAIFAGLAVLGVAIAWASTASVMTTLGLSMLGPYLIVSGLALLLWGAPQRHR